MLSLTLSLSPGGGGGGQFSMRAGLMRTQNHVRGLEESSERGKEEGRKERKEERGWKADGVKKRERPPTVI